MSSTHAALCALALLVGCAAEVRSSVDEEIQGGSALGADVPNALDAERAASKAIPRTVAAGSIPLAPGPLVWEHDAGVGNVVVPRVRAPVISPDAAQ